MSSCWKSLLPEKRVLLTFMVMPTFSECFSVYHMSIGDSLS